MRPEDHYFPASNIDTLDGLRGFACLLVVFSHAGTQGMFFSIPGTGQLGVMLFFALSGFLMEYLYGNARFGLQALASFSIRRFMRVYPIFALVVIVAAIMTANRFGYFAYPISHEELIKHLTLRGSISVLWTIPVEMKFYAIFAALALCTSAVRSLQFRAMLWTGLGFLAVYSDYGHGRSVIGVWRYVEFFLFGMAAGSVFRLWTPSTLSARRAINLGACVCVALVILAIPRIFEAITGSGHRYWNDSAFFGPLMALLVLSCAWSSGRVRWAFSNLCATAAGRISFSLYLCHLPCMATVAYFFKDHAPLIQFLATMVMAVAVSSLSYFLVESPSRKLGTKLVAAVRSKLPKPELP